MERLPLLARHSSPNLLLREGLPNCPPKLGGQRDREADPARGGSTGVTLRLWNHPPHDLDCCLDRAALLTQEGGSPTGDTPRVLQVLKPAPHQCSIDLAKPNLNSCTWPGG